jgi:hypothetical protein
LQSASNIGLKKTWRIIKTPKCHVVNGSGQNEQSLQRTFHRCFLPSFTSFGRGVSEEKIKMWKVNKSSLLKPLGQMNRNLVGSIYIMSSIKNFISSRSINKHGRHRQFLFLIGWFLKNCLLWNRLAKWIETCPKSGFLLQHRLTVVH